MRRPDGYRNKNWLRLCKKACTAFLFLLLSGGLGCSSAANPNLPKTAKVEGVVRYQGSPLPPGTITFHPQGATGNPASGQISDEGRFQLSTYGRHDGAVVGKHKVTVTVTPLMDGSTPDPPVALPKQYANADQTPLEVEVVSGKINQIEIDLTDKI